MKSTIPETVKVTLHIHHSPHGNEPYVSTSDMSEYGYILMGTDTVIITIPDVDIVQAEIDMLNRQAVKVREEFGRQLAILDRRISELTALEYKPEEPDSE